MPQPNIAIIGGGVAGLTAAYELEQAGYQPTIFEATGHLGGRLQTDTVDGYLLDRGFQVLLTAYHEAQRYLDFSALDLKEFATGAIIFKDGKSFRIADPIRDPSQFITMAISPVGTLKDKWLMWKLTQELKARDRSQVFDYNAISTIRYLQEFGFSKQIISSFFQPFFGGIFLENELTTPASMFRFVFKMFAEGKAAIPAKGIQAIPQQLKEKLKNTHIQLHSKARSVSGNQIHFEHDSQFDFDKLIITVDPSALLPNLGGQQVHYISTCNLYFTADRSILDTPAIGLVADHNSLINNFCVLTDVAPSYSNSGKVLISVTLRAVPDNDPAIYDQIATELNLLTGKAVPLKFLQRYDIPQALPIVEDLQYELQATQLTLTDDIYLAGDYLLNASLDAAMRSGRLAATALVQSL